LPFQQFDKCYIGCSPDVGGAPMADTAFCGQMAAVYLFADSLSLQQVNCLYCAGPNYQSQFQYSEECDLPDGYKKVCTCTLVE
jgi:hypothetical protein